MSERGAVRFNHRHKHERQVEQSFYPTAPGTVLQGLRLLQDRDLLAPGMRVLDPGAGRGAWGEGLRWLWPACHLTGVELFDWPAPPAYDRWEPATDFLEWEDDKEFDLVVGNPPFLAGLGAAFVDAAMRRLAPGGHLLFVLAINFVGSLGREPLFEAWPLTEMAVIPWSVSFVEDGTKHGMPYAFYLWRRGHEGPASLTRVSSADRVS